MDTLRALELRHSVRSYTDKPLSADVLTALNDTIDTINRESGLHIQLVLDEPAAFSGFLASYGSFKNVKNYFALVAKKGRDEDIGYYGQKLVLEAQKLGLNTCWVGGTFSRKKTAYEAGRGEKLYGIIPVGYGASQGHPHKSKPLNELANLSGDEPDWFLAGLEAAQLAPTATNQQSFKLSLKKGGKVELKMGRGAMIGVDEGILKYNFEVGAAAKGHTVKWA